MANTGKFRYDIEMNVDKGSVERSKAQFNDLIKYLQTFQTKANQANILGNADDNLRAAAKEAENLQRILKESYNVKLNQLNLTKFQEQLKNAGYSVSSLKTKFDQLGHGEVFNRVATEIMGTNLQLKTTNKLLDKMAITLGNTIRYGISSSVFNNLTNSISKAYSYTKNLDKSLNDIRIVSNASADDMERFAKYANESAKSLGASTLDYTKGALIYYQQGLDEASVKQRTDITLKMSNVLKTSASEVSDYMTAIWNNFDDGSQSLEHYADVITALGAATASSSEEIAEGLEKFAAVADTVGLSYEYATSALATVVAETRQSADVVGTAFKTLFARIQDLELGNALDDGTTLGKYSQALEKVGINIKTQSGELKDMNTILDEMGSKWQTLDKDQQVALAQTVAGTRQYTQLVALMDNWSTFQRNLDVARESTGTLQKQQEIYMESMEAHLQKLSTEAERTYSILFDEKSFKGLIDAISLVTKEINDMLTGLGGGLNAITNIASQLAIVFRRQISKEIIRVTDNLKAWQQENKNMNFIKELAEDITKNSNLNSGLGIAKENEQTSQYLQEQASMVQLILKNRKSLTKEEYNSLINQTKELALTKQRLEYINKLEKAYKNNSKESKTDFMVSGLNKSIDETEKKLESVKIFYENLYEVIDENQGVKPQYEEEKAYLEAIKGIKEGIATIDDTNFLTSKQKLEIDKIAKDLEDGKKLTAEQWNVLSEIALQTQTVYNSKILTEKELRDAITKDGYKAIEQLRQKGEEQEKINAINKAELERQQKIQKRVSTASAAIQGLTALTGAMKVFGDETSTASDKANAMWQGISSGAASIANMIAPGSGFIIQGVAELGKGILEVTGLWDEFIDAFKTTDEKIEDIKKKTDELKQEYEDTKNTFLDMQSDFNKYTEAENGIQRLIKGTDEWKEAVSELNNQVLVLLNEYPKLAEFITSNNGVLSIAQEGIDKILADQEKALEAQQMNYYVQQVTGSQNINTLKINEFLERQNLKYRLAGEKKKTYSEEDIQNYIIAYLQDNSILTNTDFSKLNDSYAYDFFKKISSSSNATKDFINLANSYQLNDKVGQQYLRSFVEESLIRSGELDFNNFEYQDFLINSLTRTLQDPAFLSSFDEMGLNISELKKNYAELNGLDYKDNKIYNPATGKEMEIDNEIIKNTAILNYYRKQLTPMTLKRTESISKNQQQLADILGISPEDTKNIFTGLIKGNTLNLTKLNSEQKEALSSFISNNGLGFGDSSYYGFGDASAKDFKDRILNTIQNFDISEDTVQIYEKQADAAKKAAEAQQELIETLAQGDLTKLTDEQVQELEKLESEYTQLAEIQDRGSHEYLQTLRDIKEQEEENEKDALKNEKTILENRLQIFQDKLKNAITDEEKEELKNQILDILKQIEDTDFSLKIAIDADIKSDVDDAFGLAYEIDRVKNLIKEDLTYTYAEAQDLIEKGFGAMFENAVKNADGTITANDAVVQNFIEGQKGILAADKEAKIQQLEFEKEKTIALKNAVDSELEAVEEGLNAQTQDEAEAAKAKIIARNKTTQAAIKDLNTVLGKEADNAKETIEIDQELFSELGGYYEQDAENQKVTDENSVENSYKMAETRIDHAESIYDAFKSVGAAVAESATGEVQTPFINNLTHGSVGFSNPSNINKNFASNGSAIDYFKNAIAKAQEIRSQELQASAEQATAQIDFNMETFKATLEARKKQLIAQSNSLTNQIGSYDAGIAALQTAWSDLEDWSGGGYKSGSGGGSSKEAKTIEKLDEEIDRYHKINVQITKIDNELKKVQSQQSKLVGEKLIENLNQQWALANQQIANYNEKLKIAKEEQNELANSLLNNGVIFNTDGTIANYAESYKAQEAYVNNLIDQYNRLSVEEQEVWDNNKIIDNAKEDFNKFKENLNRYDELVSDFIPQLQQNIQDQLDKQIEINIKKFNMEIEITLNMTQATRDWNEWVKRAIKGFSAEDIFGDSQVQLENFDTYFNSKRTGEVQEGTQYVNNVLEELKKMDNGEANIYGDNREQALQDLNSGYTKLMQSISDVINLQDKLQQNVIDEMDVVQEKFDQQIDSYEFLRDILNHDMKIIELTVGKDAYGEMAKFYEMQQENYNNQLDFQRQQKDFWRAQMEAAEEGSKEWDAAREKWENAVKEFNNILEEGLENAANKFENAINDIFKQLNNEVTNGKGLDYVKTEWDLINKNAEKYLDTVNATYNIRDLERKYQKSIRESDNVKVQQKLKKVMDEQIASLKEKEEITQYDIDRANKLYEIELARIALEESQQNKSNMILKRDSQGNYSYVYDSDREAIEDATSKIDNLYNGLYNFDKDRYNQTLNEIYEMWENYQKEMAEAAKITDPELRAQKEELIQRQYNEQKAHNEEAYQVARLNLEDSFFTSLENNYTTKYSPQLKGYATDRDKLNKTSYDKAILWLEKTGTKFENLSQKEKNILLTEMVPTWENGISQMADKFSKTGGKNGEDGFVQITTKGWNKIKEAENKYDKDIKTLETTSKTTFKAIKDGEDESIQKTKDLIKENTTLINTYDSELKKVTSVYNKVKSLRDMYKEAEKAAIDAATAAYNYEQQELKTQQAAAKKEKEKIVPVTSTPTTSKSSTSTTSVTTSTSTTSKSSTSTNKNDGDGILKVGDIVKFTGEYALTSYGEYPHGNLYANQTKGVIVDSSSSTKYGGNNSWTGPWDVHIKSADGQYGDLGWVRKDQISGYDTGGYTGEWNNNGKLALLHQKELVLNAQDTENMLNTVSIMRSLAYSLGSSMLARMAGVTAQGFNGNDSGNTALEQNVHIDASFPNVHNAAEIEEALNNLVNAASQRIYENR